MTHNCSSYLRLFVTFFKILMYYLCIVLVHRLNTHIPEEMLSYVILIYTCTRSYRRKMHMHILTKLYKLN